jgi:hypothetical protein
MDFVRSYFGTNEPLTRKKKLVVLLDGAYLQQLITLETE